MKTITMCVSDEPFRTSFIIFLKSHSMLVVTAWGLLVLLPHHRGKTQTQSVIKKTLPPLLLLFQYSNVNENNEKKSKFNKRREEGKDFTPSRGEGGRAVERPRGARTVTALRVPSPGMRLNCPRTRPGRLRRAGPGAGP